MNSDELYKKRRGIDLHFAMRFADHAALDTWKAATKEQQRSREEGAQARQRMTNWAESKKTRPLQAAA